MVSPYLDEKRHMIHRGAIYKFRPIFWLRPPLWLLRNIVFRNPGNADVYRADSLSDAFRIYETGHEEDVIARAKIRYVVVLSSDFESQRRNIKSLLVAPFYTLDAKKFPPDILSIVRSNNHPQFYYLPSDTRFPDVRERYINLRKIQFLDKGFFDGGKSPLALTDTAVKSIIERYKSHISFR